MAWPTSSTRASATRKVRNVGDGGEASVMAELANDSGRAIPSKSFTLGFSGSRDAIVARFMSFPKSSKIVLKAKCENVPPIKTCQARSLRRLQYAAAWPTLRLRHRDA